MIRSRTASIGLVKSIASPAILGLCAAFVTLGSHARVAHADDYDGVIVDETGDGGLFILPDPTYDRGGFVPADDFNPISGGEIEFIDDGSDPYDPGIAGPIEPSLPTGPSTILPDPIEPGGEGTISFIDDGPGLIPQSGAIDNDYLPEPIASVPELSPSDAAPPESIDETIGFDDAFDANGR